MSLINHIGCIYSRDQSEYEVPEGNLEVALGEQGSHEVHPQRHHAEGGDGAVQENLIGIKFITIIS